MTKREEGIERRVGYDRQEYQYLESRGVSY